MKGLSKALALAAGLILIALPVQQAGAFWWGPHYGPGWSNAYMYDPAYRWGSPGTRRYIRDLYRYGPAYANWRRSIHGWW